MGKFSSFIKGAGVVAGDALKVADKVGGGVALGLMAAQTLSDSSEQVPAPEPARGPQATSQATTVVAPDLATHGDSADESTYEQRLACKDLLEELRAGINGGPERAARLVLKWEAARDADALGRQVVVECAIDLGAPRGFTGG